MTWTIIPDGDIDPDSPVTTGLMTALRDNVAAAFAGDSGAPTLAALAVELVTSGEGELAASSAEVTTTSTSYVKAKEIYAAIGGTYKVKFTIKTINPASATYGQIWVGGVAVGTERSTVTNGVYIEFTEDITVTAGQLIQIYYHTTGANTAYQKAFTIHIGSGGVQAVTLI